MLPPAGQHWVPGTVRKNVRWGVETPSGPGEGSPPPVQWCGPQFRPPENQKTPFWGFWAKQAKEIRRKGAKKTIDLLGAPKLVQTPPGGGGAGPPPVQEGEGDTLPPSRALSFYFNVEP